MRPSCLLGWLLPDESNKYSETFLDRWMNGAVISAPDLIRYEVTNAIVTATKRRGRITDAQMQTKLCEFDALTIAFDENSSRVVTKDTVKISIKYDLSIYDAAYLELAKRTDTPLATLDKKLKSAAAKEKLLASM
ncbi:MAG: type II toxin-antitoxin system VapC family toxin [Verrucomicrobia bacterium]|nr:type II toxin-antitoxin system VapC family toxin [Verrucomicrobiota bacterium]